MRRQYFFIMVLSVLILAGNRIAQAQETQGKAADTQVVVITEKTPASKDAVEVGNKICPVSGEKVSAPGENGPMGDGSVKVEYKGRVYNLCCPMCIKDFENNPEKYIKKVEDELKSESETKLK